MSTAARDAVIVSTARTPIGKAYRGAFNATPSPTLCAHAIRAVVERAKVEPDEIEDCVIGAMRPARASLQFAQPQFHWGSPPPAAAPSIVSFIPKARQRTSRASRSSSAGPYMLISIPHFTSRALGFDQVMRCSSYGMRLQGRGGTARCQSQ